MEVLWRVRSTCPHLDHNFGRSLRDGDLERGGTEGGVKWKK